MKASGFGSFGSMMQKMLIGIFAIFMAMGVYGTIQVDPILQEARLKASDGDLEGATALYHQALQQDSENTEIRRELAKVIVEANVREPHTDSLEVMDVIEKGTKTPITD